MAKTRTLERVALMRGTPGVFFRRIAAPHPLYKDHHGRFVLFDAEGPGALDGISVSPKVGLLGYLDDATPARQLKTGDSISFAKSLVISSDRSDVRFTAHFTSYPPDYPINSQIGKLRKPRCKSIEFTLIETDRIDPCDETSRKVHKLTVQNESEAFVLSSNGQERLHRSHLNRMSFDVAIDPENCGVLLKKLYDRFHGRQRARVLIDGEFAGIWYAPQEDRISRWGESDFFVPAKHTSKKTEIRVEIDPFAATPLWDVAEYCVYSVKPI